LGYPQEAVQKVAVVAPVQAQEVVVEVKDTSQLCKAAE